MYFDFDVVNVSTLAGGSFDGITSGSTDGIGTSALFFNPFGIALDSMGFVYVADTTNNLIRIISPTGYFMLAW